MKVVIEQEEDCTYIAYNTGGEHCVLIGTGDTVDEAKEDFFNTIEEVKESYVELGEAVPKELLSEVEFIVDVS